MRKIILHGFIGVFGFAIVTGCGKDVKAPYNKPASAAKPTATSSPVTQAPASNSGENNNGCGSQSGNSSTGGYASGY